MLGAIARVCWILIAGAAAAFSPSAVASPDPVHDIGYCVSQASDDFKVPRVVILLILDTEGGWVGAEARNKNGTSDFGPMQVNSSWLPTLAKFGITRDLLQNHACTNIYTGTWILASLMKANKDLADVIALYHSPTPKYQAQYLGEVRKHLMKRLVDFESRQRLAKEQ
ncbi:MAG: lytic transglycosylase domain-containing protein [Dokdonella sp.]